MSVNIFLILTEELAMNISYLSIIALSLACLSSTTFAATNQPFPDDLRYAGKPIDSLCFFTIKNNKIDLKNCGAKHEKYTIKGINAELSKKGYIGYDWQDPTMPSGPQGYSYYQFFDAGNHQYWIYTVNNGGGSGDFTNLYLAKRLDPNTLSIQGIAGGDRCNSGIQDVATKNNTLTFSVNLTPYDLIDLANKKIKNLTAYDD